MSLLMEALKKAEEAKRLASENSAHEASAIASPELTLHPITPPVHRETTPASGGSPLPDLSMHIDSLDADLAAVSRDAPAKRRSGATISTTTGPASDRSAAERNAARNVFTAKQVPTTRTGLWIALGICAVVAIALGAYFWWQLRSVSSNSLTRVVAPSAPPTQPATTPPAVEPISEAQKPDTEKQTQPALPEKIALPTASAGPIEAKEQIAIRPPRAAAPTPAPTPTSGPEAPIRLSRTQPKPNQTLEQAYDALQAGRLDEARRGYEIVLNSDVKNTDALLGMATIAANLGQAEWAQAYYLRALESDPTNVTAQAGLVNTRGQADPEQSESRLRTALSNQPESPALNFALGNLYARQARWSEAQQAYFNAYSSEPENPDFIFNLAVSLDHLHQNKLALQYYQMALSTAEKYRATRSASFDKDQVKSRILELQP